MKKINLLILMLLLIAGETYSQETQRVGVVFEYDNAGNRVTRRDSVIVIEDPQTANENNGTTETTTEEQLAEIEKNFGFEELGDANIKVYPNPVKSTLMVRLENINNVEGIELQLYNTAGNLLQTKKLSTNYSEFNMNSFSSGVYILRVNRMDEMLKYKIIKK